MRPQFVLPLAGLLLLACIGFYAATYDSFIHYTSPVQPGT